jgi:hypothetical protein
MFLLCPIQGCNGSKTKRGVILKSCDIWQVKLIDYRLYCGYYDNWISGDYLWLTGQPPHLESFAARGDEKEKSKWGGGKKRRD